MTDFLAGHIEYFANYAHLWGFLIVFILMAVESSFIPFPSEVVLIPAGFMAFRGELLSGSPYIDLMIMIACGALGSLLGAYVNYYLSLRLGRPLLHKYGRYVFIKSETLDSAEEIFRKYGDITTFICRLLPAIRQLISIPAGLSKMDIKKFSLFTIMGAGIWSAILGGIGFYLSHLAGNISYHDLVYKGKELLYNNFIWILLFLVVLLLFYIIFHKIIIKLGEIER